MVHSKGWTSIVAALAFVACGASAQKIVPSPLLAIDQNRSTVVERIVNQWSDSLANSNAGITSSQLREILTGLRSDHLLAASLAGSVEGLRDVVSGALVHGDSVVSPGLIHTKALGDTNDDLVYTPVSPCRILDTRYGIAPPYNAQMVGGAAFPVFADLSNFASQGGSTTDCNLPVFFQAIAVVLTVLNPNFDAFLAASNTGDFATLTQSVVMDFSANKGLANTAIVPVDGTVKFYLGLPASVTTHVIADAVGYFKPPGGPALIVQGGNALGTTLTLGTTDNQPVVINANGTQVMSYQPDATAPIVIGGNANNSVTAGASGAVIGGGGAAGTQVNLGGSLWNCGSSCANRVTDAFGTIGGGAGNQAGDAAGTATDRAFATVGGGLNNTASGALSTVVGGYFNIASGRVSFAAGEFTNAAHDGCFVWGDTSVTGTLNCLTANEVDMRAMGGFYFLTGGSQGSGYTGAQLLPGAGAWTVHSDRASKDNVRLVNVMAVLRKVAAMPIATWNWKSQDAGIRHMGPMAQDFHAAFGLGETPKGISTVDADGVALAAIQGLHQMMQQKDRAIARLRARSNALERELNAIKVKLGIN